MMNYLQPASYGIFWVKLKYFHETEDKRFRTGWKLNIYALSSFISWEKGGEFMARQGANNHYKY